MRFLVASRSVAVSCALGLGVSSLGMNSALAQSVISSHSGVVQYVEGRAFLADKLIDPKFGQFPDIKENQEFRTEEGRAEILLTPGVFLRIGENSSIRMLSNRLLDTRVEVLSGSAMIEATEIPKDNAVSLIYKKDSIRLAKQGLYRLDTEPAGFEVFEGEALIADGSGQLVLHSGKRTNLNGVLMAESFDRKIDDQDALYRWSDRRASYVAQANVTSANAAGNSYGGYGSGYGFNGLAGFSPFDYGYGLGGYAYSYPGFLGGWAYNPVFGMYTYLPYSGFGYSPYGYTYYSPVTVSYAPTYGTGYTYGSGGSRVGRLSSGGRLEAVATHRGAEAASGFTSSARSSFHGSSAGFAHASSFGGGGGGHAIAASSGGFGGGGGGGHAGGGGHH